MCLAIIFLEETPKNVKKAGFWPFSRTKKNLTCKPIRLKFSGIWSKKVGLSKQKKIKMTGGDEP